MNVAPLFPTCDRHPVVVTPRGDDSRTALFDYLDANRAELGARLTRYGGVLFRGFDLDGPEDFRACADRMGAVPLPYIGGNSPRTKVAPDVYTSTEFPASEVIALHNEMCYAPAWPRRVFFYSFVPAVAGGQTSLASSRDVLRALPEPIVRSFRERKLAYVRHFRSDIPVGKSWQDAYQTDSRVELERILDAQGSTHAWLTGDVLRVSTTCDAIVRHPETGEEVWFNQGELWHPSALAPEIRSMYEELVGRDRMPRDCLYGDGGSIEEEVLTEVRRVLAGSKLLFDWEANDLLVVDNLLMLHGREPFRGERKTLAYLSAT